MLPPRAEPVQHAGQNPAERVSVLVDSAAVAPPGGAHEVPQVVARVRGEHPQREPIAASEPQAAEGSDAVAIGPPRRQPPIPGLPLVPYDRGRLEAHHAAAAQDAVQELSVLGGFPGRARAETLVPPQVPAQDLAQSCEVPATPGRPWERPTAMIGSSRYGAQGDGVGAQRLRPQGQDPPCDRSDSGAALERGGNRADPSRVGRTVIVGDRKHGTRGLCEREIARCRDAEARLFEVSHPRDPALLHRASRVH
jgi:hypothetical protein